mmetsp:Transcript_28960/g.53007  ORF Transcript_28960/g.53007 Transcript_28960/m.53007 type:complete len:113 (+) Transcript_28960:1326-1664(+)
MKVELESLACCQAKELHRGYALSVRPHIVESVTSPLEYLRKVDTPSQLQEQNIDKQNHIRMMKSTCNMEMQMKGPIPMLLTSSSKKEAPVTKGPCLVENPPHDRVCSPQHVS